MVQSSFYSDTPNYATDFPTQNDSNTNPEVGNTPAPSSFYPAGTAYAQADTAIAANSASEAAASAAAAAASASGAAGAVQAAAATAAPADTAATAAVGAATKWAREDHVHRVGPPSPTALGGVTSLAPVTHQFVTGINTSGGPITAQPAASDVAGLAPSATTDTTNAANISSGTLPSARLPAPTASTLGGVTSLAVASHQFVTGISTSGNPTTAQPDGADVTFTFPAPSTIVRTGTGKWADRPDVRDWGVLANGTDETLKLQNAFNNAPLYSTLWGPSDSLIRVSANGQQCVALQRPVNLRGFKIASFNTLASTVDLLSIYPAAGSGDWTGFNMADMQFGDTAAGRYGRHAINLTCDNTTVQMNDAVFERLFVLNGVSSSIGQAFKQTNTGVAGTGDVSGCLQGATIKDSKLLGGITITGGADRFSIDNCNLAPNTGTNGAMVDLGFASGTMNQQFTNNNCSATSVIFRTGYRVLVTGNTFEQTTVSYQPNGALVDFDGGGSQIVGAIVENNTFQMLNAVTPSNCVRFNNITGGKLKAGNRLSMATVTSPVVVTGSAVNTFISRNQDTVTGGAALVSGNTNVTTHDKPVKIVFVNNSTYTIDAENGDHTIALSAISVSDKAWTLPPLSHCFNGEEFTIEDIGNALGAFKIVLTAQGTDVFSHGSGSTYNIATASERVVVKALPQFGLWHVTKTTP